MGKNGLAYYYQLQFQSKSKDVVNVQYSGKPGACGIVAMKKVNK